MDLLLTLIIGGLAGWLASLVMKTDRQQGITLNVIVGIIGAFIGNFVFGLLDISAGSGFIPQLIVATVGAIILVAIVKAIR